MPMSHRQHTNAERNMPISDRLSAIRARLDAATHTERTNAEMVWDSDKAYHMEDDRHRASQALHRHAPADIAWLLEQVEELTRRVRMYEVVKS